MNTKGENMKNGSKNSGAKGNNLPASRTHLILDLKFRTAKPTPTDLQFSADVEYEDLVQDAIKSKQVGNFSNWALGACLVKTRDQFGDDAMAQLQADADISPERAMAVIYVYDRIPERVRVKELDWSHHLVVAPLQSNDEISTIALRAEWIQKCHGNNWTVRELKQQLIDAGLRKPPNVKPDIGYGSENEREAESQGPEPCACCGEEPGMIKVCNGCADKASKAAA